MKQAPKDKKSPPLNIEAPEGYTIGNDIIFLPEFKLSFNSLFKKRVYTEKEIEYCDLFPDPVLRYASTFSGKEAVYKAVKQLTNPIKLTWKKIEILREKPAGRPIVVLHAPAPPLSINLSITHDGDYVWAVVLVKKKE